MDGLAGNCGAAVALDPERSPEENSAALLEAIARVRTASPAEYDEILKAAREAFLAWRALPAPRRGEAVRLCGDALRRHKDALGTLGQRGETFGNVDRRSVGRGHQARRRKVGAQVGQAFLRLPCI